MDKSVSMWAKDPNEIEISHRSIITNNLKLVEIKKKLNSRECPIMIGFSNLPFFILFSNLQLFHPLL